ncbi:zona pellucida sperm-binding protein 1-like [Pygocentrus nattereri]|uniref:ZP domain-containing protein n=1 Tax=Pygocentrus nattereri TaxID=42514 RepID=A0A3B4EN33_PYGNA|nr:zona pellucida sperm-binding protein 1-like [Pygocentrus nattereri]
MPEHDVTACNQLQSAWNQRTDSFRNRLPRLLKAVGSCSEFTPVLGPLTSNMTSSQSAVVLLLLLTLACGLRQGSVMIDTLNSEQAVDPSEGTLDEGGAEQQGGSAEGQRYLVFCGEDAMEVVLPPGSLSEMQVFDSSGMYPVFSLPEACDYSLTRENGRVVLHVHFAGCPVTVEEGSYTLRFLYRKDAGQLEIVTVSCSNSSDAPSSKKPRSSRHPVLSYPAVKISSPQAVQRYFPYPLSPTAGEPVSVPQPDPSPLDLLFFPEFDPLFPTPGVPLPAFQWEQPSPTPTSMHVPAVPSSLGRRSKCKQRGDRLSSPRLEPLSSPEFGPLFPTPGVPPPTSQWEQLSPSPGVPLPTLQWEQLSPSPGVPLPTAQWEQLSPSPGVPLPTAQWEQLSPTPTSMQVMAMPSSLALHSNFKKGCSFSSGQRLPCGRPGTTAAECLRKGCCRDEATFACYYPMDVCLADGQFIFVVPSNVAGLPINPARLMAVGRSSCKPVIANRDFAVFKFGVTECGTRSYQIGETTVYLAEVQSPIRKRILQYGIIIRDNPVRLMVECRYSKGSLDLADSPVLADPLAPQASQSRLMKGWASAGYMVKSASLPALVRAKGLYGVQLRIAQDETFTKFCSEDHQPLKVLLGKPVYLELRINAPNPKATLVVHYCVAYPRSAKSALVLLYEGCPNPLDSDNISILYVAGQSQDPHVRRFEVKAFQFMDKSTNKYLNEEIYFMCSTEVCMPSQTPCKETCFDGKSSSTTAADVLNSYSQLKVKHF